MLEGDPQRHDLRDNAQKLERDQEMNSQNDEGRNSEDGLERDPQRHDLWNIVEN